MKTKILQDLKTKYNNLGFSTEVLDGVASQLATYVKDETEIEPAVLGAEPMLKSFQRYADARVTSFKKDADTTKAEKEALQARLDALDKKTVPPTEKPDSNEGLLELLRAEIAPLKESLTKFSEQRQQETMSKQFKELVGKDIPEPFYRTAIKGRVFKDENEMQEVIDGLKTDYAEYSQQLANEGFRQTRKPEEGFVKEDGSKIASLINKGTKQIVELKNK